MSHSSIHERPACVGKLYLFIFFLILSSGTHSILAADKIIALTEQYYPWNYTNSGQDDGEILGYATELVTAVFEEANVEYEIHIVPWSRAIQRIDSTENIVVFSMIRTPEREDKYNWIGEIQHIEYSLYGLASKVNSLPNTLDAARNFRIGVNKANAVHLYLKSQRFENLVEFASNTQFLRMLKRERLDLIPYDDSTFSLFSRRAGYSEQDFVATVRLDDKSTSVYFALSKQSKPKLTNRLKDAYKRIQSSGRFTEIMKDLEN